MAEILNLEGDHWAVGNLKALLREKAAIHVFFSQKEPNNTGTHTAKPTPCILLMVRLKAFEHLAKFYGLNMAPSLPEGLRRPRTLRRWLMTTF